MGHPFRIPRDRPAGRPQARLPSTAGALCPAGTLDLLALEHPGGHPVQHTDQRLFRTLNGARRDLVRMVRR
jgi:hypothetical protein